VNSKYGDGETGDKKLNIPPNANLLYDITLVGIDKAKATWELSKPEKLEAGRKRKEQGNAFYNKKEFRRATKRYDAVVSMFAYDKDFEGAEKAEVDKIRVACHGNIAAVRLMEKDYAGVVEHATKGLEIEPENKKILFRRAQAYEKLKLLEEATNDLNLVTKLEPDNESYQKLKKSVEQRIKAQSDKEKKLWSGFFNKVNLTEDEKDKKERRPAGEPFAAPAAPAPVAAPVKAEDEAKAFAAALDDKDKKEKKAGKKPKSKKEPKGADSSPKSPASPMSPATPASPPAAAEGASPKSPPSGSGKPKAGSAKKSKKSK